MTTDFRALCADLLDAIDHFPGWIPPEKRPVIDRARAALAEPQAEPPTDEELLETVRHLYGDQIAADMGAVDDLLTARAVLARWGNHPGSPDSST